MATSIRKDSRDHRFAADNLSAYLDGEMSARDDARIRTHLARCESCREDAATLRMTTQLLRQAPRQPLPRAIVLSPLAVSDQRSFRRWTVAQTWLRTASAIVSMLLVVLLSSDVILSQGWLSLPMTSSSRQPMPLTAQDVAMEKAEAPLQEQPVAQAVEIAPMIASIEPTPVLAPAQAVSAGAEAITEPQPKIARAVAEPLPETESAVAEAPAAIAVNTVSAAQAPLARALPQSSSAPPPGIGGGGIAPEQETQAEAVKPEAAAEIKALAAEPAQAEQPAERSAAPIDQAPVVAGKLGLPTGEPVEEEAVLLAEPEPQPAAPQVEEISPRAAEEATSEQTALPSIGDVRLWRSIRVASMLAAGLLLMLVAGLLVAAQKRRV